MNSKSKDNTVGGQVKDFFKQSKRFLSICSKPGKEGISIINDNVNVTILFFRIHENAKSLHNGSSSDGNYRIFNQVSFYSN